MFFLRYRKQALLAAAALLAALSFHGTPPPDEGMYPLSEIAKIDLVKAGLKISPAEVYNPGSISLTDALVRVGGCTGSFVSGSGLILTNHHCAFDYVQQASTVENNYLENGFYAPALADEIPAVGLTCMITESYTDVSALVLQAAALAPDFAGRTKAIQKKMRELVDAEEKADPAIRAEVAEMFIGTTYILFRYKTLTDVRLVYIPPRGIGEFGGDTDNWVWPQHNGDFSFLRAYVGKDGKPAPYAKDNVPYTPKKFLAVQPNGVKENDFVFVLGYPGRTFRHQPAAFVQFHEQYQLPYIQKLFSGLISLYKNIGANNPAADLQLAGRIKSLANTEKNYRGKMLGLRRLELVSKKFREEEQLQKSIDADPTLKTEYGTVLPQLNSLYADIRAMGRLNLAVTQLRNNVYALRVADLVTEYAAEITKPDSLRKSAYTTRNLPAFKERLRDLLTGYNAEADVRSFALIAEEAAAFPEVWGFTPIARFGAGGGTENAAAFFTPLLSSPLLASWSSLNAILEAGDAVALTQADPLCRYSKELSDAWLPVQKKIDENNGRLNVLAAKLMDAKRRVRNKSFVPDANFTLRLTFGYIRGYTPADATWYKPITTLKGVIEKGYLGGDYKLPKKVKELYDKNDLGRYKDPLLNDVPVAILYNMDTTGGNSGSPVMNAYGELIGINFDRAFEATINDYAWSESYSRSIGVDIRYVLWVTEKVGGASRIIAELGVE